MPQRLGRVYALRVGLATLACFGLAGVLFAIPSAPSYDPWSWIIWGREVAAGDLSTSGGISWKPLPVLFTAPFSLFGELAPDLWLLTARAAAVGAVAVAAVLGGRLAGRLGAVAAAGLLLTATWLWAAVLLGGSEGALVLFVLGAVERHLAGREGQSFLLWVLASLLRPEAWPFLALYGLWLAVRRPRLRLPVIAGLAAVPALWFLPDLWGSGDALRGAERARIHLRPGTPGLADRPGLAVIERAVALAPVAVLLGLVGGIATAALRASPRVRPAGWLAALGIAWLGVVAVMGEFGFSGNERYLAAPLAIATVLGGVGLAWAVRALHHASGRPLITAAASASLVVLALAATGRAVYIGWPAVRDQAGREREVVAELPAAVAKAGGEQRLAACARLYGSNAFTPAIAWTFERHVGEVTRYPRAPGVVMRARTVPRGRFDPPRSELEPAAHWRALARTEHWSVEAACE